MIYTQAQWLLFFFLYCFLGWIWECLYVSFRKKQWVNRGFLYGPIIPLYGFGAITVLWITLPVRDNIPLIFLLGMIGATILEYITGDAMERLFHVRYWDYSDQKFNLNGHICLFCSLGWGMFSVLMVRVLHLPFEDVILKVPEYIASPLSTTLVAAFAVDTTKSVQSALDLRELLKEVSENNTTLQSLEEKLSTVAENITESSDKFREHVKEIEAEIQENRELLTQKKELLEHSYKMALIDKLAERRERKSHLVTLFKNKTAAFIAELEDLRETEISENDHTRFSSYVKELNEFMVNLERIEHSVHSRKEKEYQKAFSIIRRNPSATSNKFAESFKELKDFHSIYNNHSIR